MCRWFTRHHSPPELDRTSPVLVICAGSGSDAIGALKEGHIVYAIDYSNTMHRAINSRLSSFVQLESERFELALQANSMSYDELLKVVSKQAAEDCRRTEQELAFRDHVIGFLEGGRDEQFGDNVQCDALKLYVKYALDTAHLKSLHSAQKRAKLIAMLLNTCGKSFTGAWNHFLDNLPPDSDVQKKVQELQLAKVDDDMRLLEIQEQVGKVAAVAGFQSGKTNDWPPPQLTPAKVKR